MSKLEEKLKKFRKIPKVSTKTERKLKRQGQSRRRKQREHYEVFSNNMKQQIEEQMIQDEIVKEMAKEAEGG